MAFTISQLCLCLVALAVAIQSLPMTIIHNLKKTSNQTDGLDRMQKSFMAYGGKINIYDYSHRKIMQRHVPEITDGSFHQTKAGPMNHRRVLVHDQCFLEYDGQLHGDGSIIQIRKKLYKVEECAFERVFHACGPNLLLLLNAACRAVEKHNRTPIKAPPTVTTTTIPTTAIMTTLTPSWNSFHQHENFYNGRRLRPRANKAPRVITESCCENVCTIQELTRYCHR